MMEGQDAEQATDKPQVKATPELPASEAQAVEAAQAQEAATMYSDIVVFCHPRNMGILVQAFEAEIKHAAGELPVVVLWSGVFQQQSDQTIWNQLAR